MNPEKKPIEKQGKDKSENKSADAVITPQPPQHMDPSKKPEAEEGKLVKKSQKG